MITNKTKKTTICREVEIADSPYSRAKGLMFRRSLSGGMLMPFDKTGKHGIWTFGMLFSIDIIWLDDNCTVVGLKKNAKPFRYIGYPKNKAAMVLELKAGILKKTRTQEGDILKISL